MMPVSIPYLPKWPLSCPFSVVTLMLGQTLVAWRVESTVLLYCYYGFEERFVVPTDLFQERLR